MQTEMAGYPRSFVLVDENLSRHRHRSQPTGIAALNGVVLVADGGRHCIWKYEIDRDTKLKVFAGKPDSRGSTDGKATIDAQFSNPGPLAVDRRNKTVYVVDDYRIRKIRDGVVTTLACDLPVRELRDIVLRRGGEFVLVLSDEYVLNVSTNDGTATFVCVKDESECLKLEATYLNPVRIAETWDGDGIVVFCSDDVTLTSHVLRNGVSKRVHCLTSERVGAYCPALDCFYTFSTNSGAILARQFCGTREARTAAWVDCSIHYYKRCLLFVEDHALYFAEVPRHSEAKDFKVYVVSLKPSPQLIGSVSTLIGVTPKLGDVVFRLSNGIKIPASRAVLCERSDYFCRMFESPFKEAASCASGSPIDVPDSPDVFSAIITYLHSGTVDFSGFELTMKDLVLAADRYLLCDLRKLCLKFMMESVSLVTVIDYLNMCDFLKCDELKENCIEFALDHIRELRSCNKLIELKDALLNDLISPEVAH